MPAPLAPVVPHLAMPASLAPVQPCSTPVSARSGRHLSFLLLHQANATQLDHTALRACAHEDLPSLAKHFLFAEPDLGMDPAPSPGVVVGGVDQRGGDVVSLVLYFFCATILLCSLRLFPRRAVAAAGIAGGPGPHTPCPHGHHTDTPPHERQIGHLIVHGGRHHHLCVMETIDPWRGPLRAAAPAAGRRLQRQLLNGLEGREAALRRRTLGRGRLRGRPAPRHAARA